MKTLSTGPTGNLQLIPVGNTAKRHFKPAKNLDISQHLFATCNHCKKTKFNISKQRENKDPLNKPNKGGNAGKTEAAVRSGKLNHRETYCSTIENSIK